MSATTPVKTKKVSTLYCMLSPDKCFIMKTREIETTVQDDIDKKSVTRTIERPRMLSYNEAVEELRMIEPNTTIDGIKGRIVPSYLVKLICNAERKNKGLEPMGPLERVIK